MLRVNRINRQVTRNRQILMAAQAGQTQASIAQEQGITANRVQQIVQRERRWLQIENDAVVEIREPQSRLYFAIN